MAEKRSKTKLKVVELATKNLEVLKCASKVGF